MNDYSPPSIQTAREHLTALIEAYQAATGLPPTYIGIVARGGDPKFCRSYLINDFGFRSYDTVVSRFSAIWPGETPWPVSVPRQAPAVIEPDMLADLSSRIAKIAASRAAPTPEKETTDG